MELVFKQSQIGDELHKIIVLFDGFSDSNLNISFISKKTIAFDGD
ncbi:hypothetical protein [Bartonella tamiae]|uniref:Uncharacterized protein n=1 Tax=Bartonella tamiae Th239 TaxID=1094558 RepID=J0ZKW3_9HYPH|nr:hypothetical protein [Bartonella tamiae]EJF89003.1 hypothetical protein ME5_01554 [Bartonella tamiae Th239]EJF94747.1 hypothetical protein MEG_00328 [Bartonella tamiae Th307]